MESGRAGRGIKFSLWFSAFLAESVILVKNFALLQKNPIYFAYLGIIPRA